MFLTMWLGLAALGQQPLPPSSPPSGGNDTAGSNRLPFETGAIRLDATSHAGKLSCSADWRGAPFEATGRAFPPQCSALPPPTATADAGLGPAVTWSTFYEITRAGEAPVTSLAPVGEKLHEVLAEVTVAANGAIASCEIIDEYMEVPASFFMEHGAWCRDAMINFAFLPGEKGTSEPRRGRVRVVTAMAAVEPEKPEAEGRRSLDVFNVPPAPGERPNR